MIPITTAAGRSNIVFVVVYKLPNFKAPESVTEIGDPWERDYIMLSVNVPTLVAKNTRQSILNVQKVLGFEISYENKAPPIGAPKAQLTPTEDPAAMICRRMTSFYSTLNFSNGKNVIITPIIAPI